LKEIAMTTKTVEIQDAPSQFAELLSLVAAGTEVILTDHTTPVARLVPVNGAATARIAGLHSHLGSAWMSDDFNDPLPDEFWIGTDEAPAG
jgi:prevent-host-death family protein